MSKSKAAPAKSTTTSRTASKSSVSARISKKQSAMRTGAQWNFPLTKNNFVYFGIAIAVIILGYALMATGITADPQKYLDTWANSFAIVVAPTLLVVAYCILIPFAIMKREKSLS
jgi:Protein of unknown function (DUF3098)